MSGADDEDEEALMQRALELSLRDLSTEEAVSYHGAAGAGAGGGDEMVTSDANDEDEVSQGV